jgi:hypothetical protein
MMVLRAEITPMGVGGRGVPHAYCAAGGAIAFTYSSCNDCILG